MALHSDANEILLESIGSVESAEEDEMVAQVQLSPGWFVRDVQRASDRLNEWSALRVEARLAPRDVETSNESEILELKRNSSGSGLSNC